MRAIYEDYGRASQELQDRINVLGYNLNEHLKETKDQIASTPQRLLNLETKYVAGEVSDGEYRDQREEFKGLLERNLHSIEEIRSMITVLSHIEARPLTPAEFKHVTPTAVKTPTAEGWSRTAIPLTGPVFAPTLPTTTVPRFLETQPASAPFESPASKFAPSSPQPQSNGTNWTNPNPQPTNAPEIAPPASAVETPPVAAPVSVAPVVASQPSPAIASTSGPTMAAPSLDTRTTSVEDLDVDVPSVDVEGTIADDALMVKVVDEIPAVEASATVTSPDTSQVEPSTIGSSTTPSVPGVSSEVAQLSLTPPTQFYKVVCPKCGADVPKPAKVWELKGGKSKKNVLIGLFQCQDCRVKFREALTREIL
jgi:hypothetical protein